MAKKPSDTTRLSGILRTLELKPFTPHKLLPSADLQTILGLSFPYFKDPTWKSERQLIAINEATTIAADFSLQAKPQDHATVIIVPGIYGVSSHPILLAMSHKAFHAGYNVVRLNLPNQSGTAHLTKKYYYIGQSEVITGAIRVLSDRGLKDIFLVGISYGGNIVAKALGELAKDAHEHIRGAALLSPSIDPLSALHYLEQRRHPVYQRSIVHKLNTLNKARSIADPNNVAYDPQKTLRAWMDRHMTAPEPIGWGYKNSKDYLAKNSSLPWIPRIAVPMLIIHAKDDPLVPFDPVISKEVTQNPNICLLTTDRGGHCGFIAHKKYKEDADRHWDQNRAIEFFRLLA